MANANGNNNIDYSSGGVFSWIAQGLANIANFFTTVLDYLNPFSENFFLKNLFTSLGTWFSDLGSSIGGFFSNLWNSISSFFAGIPDFFRDFWNTLGEFFINIFKVLFVPSEEAINKIPNIFKEKFAFIDSIKIGIKSIQNMYENINALPKLTINIPENRTGITEITVIDLAWYQPYKHYGDLVMTGFIYLLFIWRLYVRIPSILSGASSEMETSFIHQDIVGKKGKG